MTTGDRAREAAAGTERYRRTALLVAGCFFMENLDGTVVTTAAPRMSRALHVP